MILNIRYLKAVLFVANQPRRGSISRLGFYILENQRRHPAGVSKAEKDSKLCFFVFFVKFDTDNEGLQVKEFCRRSFLARKAKSHELLTRAGEGGQGSCPMKP